MKTKTLQLLFLGIMVIGSVGLDQLSKVHSEQELMVWQDDTDIRKYRGKRIELMSLGKYSQSKEDTYLVFSFNYVRNPGAAWGTLAKMPDKYRIPFFHVVTAIAVCFIGVFFYQTPRAHKLARFALALVLSGAIGNFIDRLRLGYVIDWIDVRWSFLTFRYNFPNFNVADCAISVGVAFILFDIIVLDRQRTKCQKEKDATEIS